MELKTNTEHIARIMKYKNHLLIISLFLIFFFLRLYRLGSHDFWYDEVGTIRFAQYPWQNWNAPLYYITLFFWTKIFKISEVSLRLPSALFSFFPTVLIYLFGKDLFSKKVGLISSVIIGLSGFHLWYAQEARDYSFVLFLSISSSFLLHRALEIGKIKYWLLFAIISSLGFYTNYFYIFLFFGQALFLIYERGFRLNFKELRWFLIPLTGFIFYLPKFLKKYFYVKEGFWTCLFEPSAKSLLITLENFMLGYSAIPLLYFLSNIIIGGSLVNVLMISHKNKQLRKPVIFCLCLFFVPILLVFSFSRIVFSIYIDRGLIIFSPYIYLIIALGISGFSKRWSKLLVLVLIVVMLISDYAYFNNWMIMPLEHHLGTYIKKPVKPLVKFLKNNLFPQDIISFTNPAMMQPWGYYNQDKTICPYFLFDQHIPDSISQRPLIDGSQNISLPRINKLKFKRLWVIASDWARSGRLDENSHAVKNWLDNNLELKFYTMIDGVWIYRYERP